MKHFKTILALAGAGATFGLVASLSTPVASHGFSLLGHNLGNAQRDFRVFNNFSDSTANNNTTPHVNFPGHTGAVMAIWKGHSEWGSGPWAGNGLGDGVSSNSNIGDGGANFDNHFQGLATSSGTTSTNIHSALGGSSGGTLAFMQGGSNGWWVRYYESWTWQDGPGNVTSGTDLQGVACHEIGHTLGLGHSNTSGATMLPSISGTGVGARSINTDDTNGIKAIYGVKSGSKPQINSISGDFTTGTLLTIAGTNFATNNNEVWFTAPNSTGFGTRVTNVSSTGGGTQIQVTIPSNVADGVVMVNSGAGTHVGLSNAFPIDIGGGGGPPLDPPDIVSINPTLGPAGGWTPVTITGTGFLGVNDVEFGGIDARDFEVNGATEIVATTPENLPFSSVSVFVQDPDGTDVLNGAFLYTFNIIPNVDTVTPPNGPDTGGTTVEITGTMVSGVTSVTFDGVPGTNLEITSLGSLVVDTPPGTGIVDVALTNSSGTFTLTNGFTYDSGIGGQFVNLGPSGVGGSLGEPTLNGVGDLTPGGSGYDLTIANCPPSAFGILFIGIGDGSTTAGFKGGTFYVLPLVLQVGFNLPPSGDITLPLTVDGSVVGPVSLLFQWWCQDNSAPQLVGGSNGLRADIP